ncbi:MerR family transcriptional regulator [Mycolicibacterium mengxianglii]|uniref:MerR family transcriptional regulator n=1 Tax=Mycolicibacterium mengxianglii TaxID=2736649 RepID=UPI001E618AAB|nr:MerR family transcriptional regulator [Mycolicibacterium mengxianglii]
MIQVTEMTERLSIGDFSRMTQLSVKALRHYHDVGLVTPVYVDPATGYRYYSQQQIPTVQVVRRLRELDMPVAEVRAVLAAQPAQRHSLISEHLRRLEAELAATRGAVESLRALLERPQATTRVEHRSVPPTPAVGITDTVDRDDLVVWWQGAVAELQATVTSQRLSQTGVLGALFGFEIFSQDRGEVTAFIPVREAPRAVGRPQQLLVPPAELAVLRHHGPHDDVDLAYSALGDYATRHEISVDGPLREYYHRFYWDTEDSAQWETDLCWPVFRSDATEADA